MYSGREGTLGVEKAPRRQPRGKELDVLVQWLVDRGVARKAARKYIIKCAIYFYCISDVSLRACGARGNCVMGQLLAIALKLQR